MNKLLNIFIGIFLIIIGSMTIVRPEFYSYRYERHIDFTGYNIPLGIFMIVVGGLFIWTSVRKKKGSE